MPRRSVSLARLLLAGQLEAARQPTFTLARSLDLGSLARERLESDPPPTWRSLFLHALGQVATRWPELRTTYRAGWRPYLDESRSAQIAVAIARHLDTEPILFLPVFVEPAASGVAELDRRLRLLQDAAIESVPGYRAVLRRAAWSWPIGAASAVPCTLAVLDGGWMPMELLPGTLRVRVEPPEANGRAEVAVGYDPRVVDEAMADRVLADLSETLRYATLAETRYLRRAG